MKYELVICYCRDSGGYLDHLHAQSTCTNCGSRGYYYEQEKTAEGWIKDNLK